MIASQSVPTDRTAGEAAAGAARLAIAGSTLAEPDRAQAQALIDQLLRRSGTGARWPADLFNPAPGLRSQTSRVALPDGEEGSVTTTIDAHSDALGVSIERTIVTETGGVQRVTREIYTVRSRHG
jgi:hypothetical protein